MGFRLLVLEAGALPDHLAAHLVGLVLEGEQPGLLHFQKGRCLPDFQGLPAHLGRKVAKVAEAAEPLPHRLAGQEVHIPQAAVTVLVRTPDKPCVIVGKGVVAGLQAVQLPLADTDGIPQEPQGLVAAGNELFPGRYLAAHQREGIHRGRTAFGVLGQLTVEHGDVLFQLRPLAFQFFDTGFLALRGKAHDQRQQEGIKDSSHCFSWLSRRSAWLRYTLAVSASPRASRTVA